MIALGDLLHQYQLRLVLIAGATDTSAGLPVQWVHASELEDPTPFLLPHTVLLTTGARFDELGSPDHAEAYVRRLVDAQTTALGVAVGLHFDRIPTSITDACERYGLPLFRVPYETAFIAISQTAARLIAALSRERDVWLLEAQRAVTAASLHRDGLTASVREAASRLGRWVAITDRTGRIVEAAPSAQGALAIPHDAIRRESRHLISRGLDSARVEASTGGMQLQALGRRNRLLGVLVVDDAGTPDHAERAFLAHIASLITLQLDHRAGLDRAEAVLRRSVFELLLHGERGLAEQIADGVLTRIPRNPVVVIAYRATGETSFADDLASFDAGSAGLVRAEHDGRGVILTEARHLPHLRRILMMHDVAAGVSERGTIAHLADRATQADRALEYAEIHEIAAPVDYLPALNRGILAMLDDLPDARTRARGLLEQVHQHDERHGDHLERCLTVWLAHHGQTSPAAAELGVHRHTLRSRIETAAQLLQRDLGSPDARAELWTALRLAGTGG